MRKFIQNLLILISFLPFLSQCQNQNSQNYKDANVSFNYPAKWESASSDIKTAFLKQLEGQLNVYDGKIIELQLYILESSSGAMFVFDKAKVPGTLTMDSLLRQRKQVDKDAMASGYLAKLNKLELINTNGIPMLIEDFIVENGGNSGRSYNMRTIVKSVIYEFTVAGLNNDDFPKYKGYLDKIITSFIPSK